MERKENEISRIIGNSIIIGSCDGSRFLADTIGSTFRYTNSRSCFEAGHLNKPGKATQETKVQPYEIVKAATFLQIFSSFEVKELDELCLTQHQIEMLCEEHQDWWIRTIKCAALIFLFKENNQFYVAGASMYDSGNLNIGVYRFDDDRKWMYNRGPLVAVIPFP